MTTTKQNTSDLCAEVLRLEKADPRWLSAYQSGDAGETARILSTAAPALARIVERVQDFAADMERKGTHLRGVLADLCEGHLDRPRLHAKASLYEEEARRLRALLEVQT